MASCVFGSHRVLEPIGSLPQAATRLDATMVLYDNELLIDVDTLNIDSASFTQLKSEAKGDEETLKALILALVKKQGKMQNPITKSGGMLIGRVKEIGPKFPNQTLTAGTMMATLVSLSLTPLRIDEIQSIDVKSEQVRIKGEAILFASGIYAPLPENLPKTLALALLDVAGAPAQVHHLVKQNDTVLVLGAAGKSGLLALAAAREKLGEKGRLIALVNEPEHVSFLSALDLADEIVCGDATNALAVYNTIHTLTKGAMVDIAINVVNVENTEMASILATKQHGIVYFFSMATSFTRAALGAEGAGRDVTMLIGNGYKEGHAAFTFELFERTPKLHAYFTSKYGGTHDV